MTPISRKDVTPEQAAAVARRRFFNIWALVGIIALFAVLGYVLNVLALPVSIILWTLVFVFCLSGLVDWLEKKGLPRALGTTVAYVIMFAVLGAFVFLLFSPAFGLSAQFSALITAMPSYANNFMSWANSTYDSMSHLFQDDTIKTWLTDIATAISSAVTDLFEGGATGIVAIGSGIVNGVIAIGFALVIAFWILMELPALDREARRLMGPERMQGYNLFSITVTRVVGGYIKATLLQCLVIGALCALLFVILNLPSAFALAGIVAVFNLVPVIGQWIAIVVVAIVALFVSPLTALIVIVVVIIIQQFVYTFVSPKLMSNSVDIHPVLTLLVLVIGSAIGGAMGGMGGSIVGMLLSIPAAAIIKSLFVYYFEKATGRQLVAYDGVFFQGTPSDTENVDPMADALSPADHEKEQQLLERDRLQRTGRIEAIRQNAGAALPKLELPFIKHLHNEDLPTIEVPEEHKGGEAAKDPAKDSAKDPAKEPTTESTKG